MLDFRRLTPALLETWSETLEVYAGAEKDVMFFCGGKRGGLVDLEKGKLHSKHWMMLVKATSILCERPFAMAIIDRME